MKNFDSILTDLGRFDNRLEDINGLFDLAPDMISQYTAGKQEEHYSKVNGIEKKYREGLLSRYSSQKECERFARRNLSNLISGVCQKEKVIKF